MNLRHPMFSSRSLALFGLAVLVAAFPALAFAQDAPAITQTLSPKTISAAFTGGLLINLTPCVYPLIVITTSVFGARQAKSRLHAAMLSTCYVMGISVLYTTLLVITGLVGGTFGAYMQSRGVNIALSVVFAALAASLFGAFEMTLPESMMQKLSGVGGIGPKGAFTLGLVSGLIAAPCSGPVTIGIVTMVGQAGGWQIGAVLGFVFSIGLGLPTWVVGTFAVGLPKGGRWMVWIKSFFGCVMVAVSLYYLKNAFPSIAGFAQHNWPFIIPIAAITVLGLLLGAVHVNWDEGGTNIKLQKAFGIAATSIGAFLLVAAFERPKDATAEDVKAELNQARKDLADAQEAGPAVTAGAPKKPTILPEESQWSADIEKAIDKAKSENRPVLIDFRADWCGACKELERETFADQNFRSATGKFVPVRVDLSNDDDPNNDKIKTKYGIKGLPVVLVLDSKGAEQKRITEFVKPEKLLSEIEGID